MTIKLYANKSGAGVRRLGVASGVLGTCLVAATAFGVSASGIFDDADGPLPHRTDLTLQDRIRVAAVLEPPQAFDAAQPFEAMSGGAGTYTGAADSNAFSRFTQNITFEQQSDFHIGDSLFTKLWVSSPSSTQASDGLGPLFNARSCQSCHLKDGRGHPPVDMADSAISMFLRLSVPPRTEAEFAALESREMLRIPEPTYGGQFQDLAVPGLQAEGRMVIEYTEEEVVLGDGEVVSLRRPTYSVANLGFGPMDPEVMLSPRVAPPMIGLGLIEAIHPGDLLANADPDDSDGDGVSGRPSWVISDETGDLALGRFGWKATNPTVRQQSAGAFSGDIGISTPDASNAYGDCTDNQDACLAMASGVQPRLGETEAPDPVLDLVTFYASNLAVPMRRDVEHADVLRGKELFHDVGCAACHTPSFVTSRNAATEAHRFQLIWPYSDFLLHDMGEGLADNRPVGDASGREWKTPPLWGIGLTETVNGHTQFLHDGRARSLLEAVLWHGGEAQAARDSVVAMQTDDRNALIRFLESL
ncbi:MAG: di-heme oxidoredictase family protein [Pseudomonadota bacterium]